jgi:hypothetical protein
MAVKIHWSIKANYRNNHEREEGIELVVRLKGKDLPQHASTMYDSTNHDQSRFSAFPNPVLKLCSPQGQPFSKQQNSV